MIRYLAKFIPWHLSKIQVTETCKDDPKDNGWNREKGDKRTRTCYSLPQKLGCCIILNRHLSYSIEDFSWLCPSWTIGSTVTALMTEPDIRITKKFIFQTPLCVYHLFSRKWLIILG